MMQIPGLYNLPQQKIRRHPARKGATAADMALWQRLQHGQLQDRLFVRQYDLGGTVVDFYCPEEFLVIELQNVLPRNLHAWEDEQRRERFLLSLGLRILYIKPLDVQCHLDVVLKSIMHVFE
jgi:very-short-patch-repair endonuclease